MLGRLLTILNSLVALPPVDAASEAQAEQSFRNVVWTERQNDEPVRNAQRMAWFCGVSAMLKMPGVPDWMGPWPQRRFAKGAGAVSSQPVPVPAPASPKRSVHLVTTGKKAVAQ